MGDGAGAIFVVAVATKTPTLTLGASSSAFLEPSHKTRSRAKHNNKPSPNTRKRHGIEQDGTNVRRREASCYIRCISSYEGGIYRKRNYCLGREGGCESEHVSLYIFLLLLLLYIVCCDGIWIEMGSVWLSHYLEDFCLSCSILGNTSDPPGTDDSNDV